MFDNLALSDNGFLFDTRTGSTFSLSGTGTFLLRALMEGANPGALGEHLSEAYEVDLSTASRDVDQFVFRLRDLGLVLPNGPDGSLDSSGEGGR